VNDIEAAKRFYGETLGITVSENPAGLGIELAGGNSVFVYPKENHEPATFTILNFQVADVDATVGALTERGVEFERYEGTELETDEKGVFRGEGPTIAWFKDPAGNVLSVIDENA
jgi:predicted enzyme related to lactoylglutathione lyase